MTTESFIPEVVAPGFSDQSALWFVFQGNRLLTRPAGAAAEVPRAASPQALGLSLLRWQYLGRLGGRPCYSAEVAADAAPPAGWAFDGLRALYGRLDDDLFGVAGRAVQIMDWDRSHLFCGRCGAATEPKPAERARVCVSCGYSCFPRIAPAIMVLIRNGDRLLLARGPHFPPGRYSAIAGFVEPGETLEEAVRREAFEEVGVAVRDLRYFSSQPWPYPHSLMVAFHAELESGEIRADGVEIEAAGWFGLDGLPDLPPRDSIAWRLIQSGLDRLRAEAAPAPIVPRP